MLVIVMHNNQKYLDYLMQLARKENILDSTIIEEKSIGTSLIGPGTSFILSQGRAIEAYTKAFVTTIKGETKTRQFLEVLKQDSFLDRINVDDKGFICAVPFQYIKRVEFESVVKNKEEDSMKITNFLKEERMILDLKASNKEDAINELAGLLKNTEEISDFDSFRKDVFERESVGSTGIGNNVAIPHARTDSVTDFVVAFGRSSNGVEFNSLDGKAVKFIFLMGTSKNKNLNSYLMILSHLTRLLNKADFRELLGRASNPKEIIEAFTKQNGDR